MPLYNYNTAEGPGQPGKNAGLSRTAAGSAALDARIVPLTPAQMQAATLSGGIRVNGSYSPNRGNGYASVPVSVAPIGPAASPNTVSVESTPVVTAGNSKLAQQTKIFG